MTEQPTALRLAERLAVYLPKPQDMNAAASELRRLHAENEALLEVLTELVVKNKRFSGGAWDRARAAIKKAEEA